MTDILRRLILMPKNWRDALLAPARDPREEFPGAYQSHGEVLGQERPGLEQLQEAIRSGLSSLDPDTGLKVFQKLVYEYEQLQPVLDRKKGTDPLSIAHIPPLVEGTYRRGLSVLADALELMRAIRLPDRDRLRAEVVQLEREIESVKGDDTQGTRLKMKEETLASHVERLEMVKQQQLRVDELLHQCGRCEASLHRTRVQLASLRAEGSETGVSAVTETLRKTIDQAREVQEELKRLGY